jgi:hypothetical protein
MPSVGGFIVNVKRKRLKSVLDSSPSDQLDFQALDRTLAMGVGVGVAESRGPGVWGCPWECRPFFGL